MSKIPASKFQKQQILIHTNRASSLFCIPQFGTFLPAAANQRLHNLLAKNRHWQIPSTHNFGESNTLASPEFLTAPMAELAWNSIALSLHSIRSYIRECFATRQCKFSAPLHIVHPSLSTSPSNTPNVLPTFAEFADGILPRTKEGFSLRYVSRRCRPCPAHSLEKVPFIWPAHLANLEEENRPAATCRRHKCAHPSCPYMDE